MILAPFEHASTLNMDLSATGIVVARQRFHERFGFFPNVVCHAISMNPILDIQKLLRDRYGIDLPFVEVCEMDHNAWCVDRIGHGVTTPLGSPGA